jgi:hypothetical protein
MVPDPRLDDAGCCVVCGARALLAAVVELELPAGFEDSGEGLSEITVNALTVFLLNDFDNLCLICYRMEWLRQLWVPGPAALPAVTTCSNSAFTRRRTATEHWRPPLPSRSSASRDLHQTGT